MFGYIHATKEQLGEEYDIFCSYYCGLCKELGKNCSQMSRLGLSYDITFLAIVLSSLVSDEEKQKSEHCIAHPVKKVTCVKDSKVLDYCANVASILSYEKCLDDWHDDKSLKALIGIIAYKKAYKKAHKRFGETAEFIKDKLSELSKIEREGIKDVDMAADKFAQILSKLFAPDFIEDNNTRRQLEWFGYNVGRWIYIIDAINDICDDYRSGSYNAFLQDNIDDIKKYCQKVAQKEEFALTFTLENIASTFDLMKCWRNYELLRKIIYISFPQKQMQILQQTGGDNGSL